jgi:hypothetical protein
MKIKVLLVIMFILPLMFSCGGGGSSSSVGTVSVFITDDISRDYSKAWITIQKITAISTDGVEYVLFEDTVGKVFNLLELSGIGALLNITTLPEGIYNDIKVTVKNEIVLVDHNGNTINAKFATTGEQYVIDVHGTLTIIAERKTSFALDFDTKQFSYDPTTGLVSAVVIFKPENELKDLYQSYAEIEGYVVEVLNDSSFTLQIEDTSVVITVTLHVTAVVFDENTGAVSSDTSLLEPSQKVEVYGNYDASTLTLEAISVKIEKTSSSEHMAEVEGFIQSINGTTIVVDVKEAEHFVPISNTITVNVSSAKFIKGSIEILAEGQWVEIKGTWDGAVFTAVVIEIEGAPCGECNTNANTNTNTNGNQNCNMNTNSNNNGCINYVEIKGTVQTVNTNTIIVSITEAEHFVPPSNTIEIDISTAWFKHCSSNDLAPGVTVEVKGIWNGSIIIATVVEIEWESS